MITSDDNITGQQYCWDPQELRVLRHLCETNGIAFMQYFFKLNEGTNMLVNWHHFEMQKVLQKVLDGEITRLIINVPPGYTKTAMAVISFIARGLAINPRAKFIHASSGADLAQENSSKIRDIIITPEFQDMWPMKIRIDTKGKKRWFTEAGGGMMAAPAGGQITGFRAGRMEPGFTGCFVADDLVKPDDAYSPVKRGKINDRFNSTMRSRLATEDVPMVIIMQRIHTYDISGFLLSGGSGDIWDHLTLPALIDENTLARPYPEEYTHGRPIDVNLPSRVGALWEEKHTVEELRILQNGDIYTFNAQMQQEPTLSTGGMFKDHWWRHYELLPTDIDMLRIYCDTAQKTQEHHDFSVFQLWARSKTKGIFMVDQVRGKWEAPELETALVEFWTKHKKGVKGVRVQCIKVEDKSSGSSLIQSIKRKYLIPIQPIPRHKDKVLRAMGVANYFSSGYIHLPPSAHSPWMHDYKEEFRHFSPLMTHAHDDQIDPTMDAVEDMLINNNKKVHVG